MPGQLVKLLFAFCWAASCVPASGEGNKFPWLSPVYPLYSQPLVVPEAIQPLQTFKNKDGSQVEYFEVDIKPFYKQIYPNLKATRMVGYNGQSPGPTFRARKGTEAVVRFINHADLPNSVHLHGSYSRSPFDGWADDKTEPGQYKDYYYPNRQNARTLWYHDHAAGHTAKNSYFGQAGFYILSDDEQDRLGLPAGKYDLPLALSSKRYNADGSLWDPEANHETVSLPGDVIHVNGVPWPYHRVEPRKYRLRFLNTGISRNYKLYLEAAPADAAGKPEIVPLTVFASDAGLTVAPVDTQDLYVSVAERWEVIVDFSRYAGRNVTLRNRRGIPGEEDFAATDQAMRFLVGRAVSDWSGNLPRGLPAKLRDVDFPPPHAATEYQFEFSREISEWVINGVVWSEVNRRVLARPPRGAVQKWALGNPTGAWSHPIHTHLVDVQMTRRSGGRGALLPYEKVALKDTLWLDGGEEVDIVARFAPWDGLYMFHCHNLIHEDHEMLAAFNVTALRDFGYPETTRFLDPMEPRYRPVAFREDDLRRRTGPFSYAAVAEKVNFFMSLGAYSQVDKIEAALERYWATKTVKRGEDTPTQLPTTLWTVPKATPTGRPGWVVGQGGAYD